MRVDEQHDSIGEYAGQLRETRIALFGGEIGGHSAAGKRLEPQQQPHRIVGDVEIEAPVGSERQSHLGSFGFMRDGCWREQHDQHEQPSS